MCVRCLRTDLRIVRGLVCVSCANREYEQVKGRNAKGKPPAHAIPLRPAEITYLSDSDGRPRRISFPRVTSTLEAMLSVLRRSGRVEFCRTVHRPGRQLSLWEAG